MPLTWRKAPTVKVGDRITSKQHNYLARAWNDRIKSGIGDSAWRIIYYAHSLFRKVRLDDGGSVTPEDEWWKIYAILKSKDNVEWPTSSPGTAGGANLDSPMMAWVHGDTNNVISSEDGRVNIGIDVNATTLEPIWAAAKVQRGFISPDTGIGTAPAWTAAREHLKVGQNHASKYLVSYGSFQPTPSPNGNCGDTPATPKFDFPFTATAAGILDGKSDITYTGFCPSGSTGAGDANAIRGIILGPEAYYVLRHNNTVDVLTYKNYLLGPFTDAGTLIHGEHGGYDQILNRYLLDYRGSESQRAEDDYDVRQVGFQFQKFFTRQYLLAPQNSDAPIYVFPQGVVTAGTHINGSPRTVIDTFNFSGIKIKASGITAGPVVVRIEWKGEIVARLTLDADGSVAFLAESDFSGGDLAVIADSNWTSTLVEADILELYKYKPGIADAYVVLRQSTATSAFLSQAYEGDGTGYSQSKEAGDSYFNNGGIVNVGSAGLGPQFFPSNNSIYESARKLVFSNCRMLPPANIKAYEVLSGDLSVIYFDRYSFGMGSGFPLDSFEDMIDGIETEAPKKGYSKDWVMFFSWAHYHTSNTAWTRENHEGIYGFLNQASQVYSDEVKDDGELGRHFAPGENPVKHSESPPGYRYAKATNGNFTGTWTDQQKADHYSSIQVYQAPYEIKSIRLAQNGWVRVELKSRLQKTATAPTAPISTDVSTWNKTDLTNEAYATDENRLRKFLYHGYDASNFVLVTGDAASDGLRDLEGEPTPPFGAYIPRAYFVKLIPEVYIDDNEIEDSDDTRLEADPYVQLDFYSRPVIEGFLDEIKTTTVDENDCSLGGGMYDFSFENAVNRLTGGRWLSVLPLTLRSDGPKGFGPLPNTIAYASIYNQFADLINLCTAVRLDLPLTLERQFFDEETRTPVSYDFGTDLPTYLGVSPPEEGQYGTDLTPSNRWAVLEGIAPSGTPNAGTGWVNWAHSDTLSVDRASNFELNKAIGLITDDPWRYQVTYTEVYYQWRIPSTQNAYNAIPSEIQGLISNADIGVFGNFSRAHDTNKITVNPPNPDTITCGGLSWPGDPIRVDNALTLKDTCGFMTGEKVVADNLISSGHAIQVDDAGNSVCRFGGASMAMIFSLASNKIGNGNLFIRVPVVDQTESA